jgi:RecB family exonuclease
MTEEKLLQSYDAAWKNGGFQNKKFEKKMKDRGVALLSDFFRHGFDPNVKVIDLEKAFKVKITPTLTVGGKIDRVDADSDGNIEIIDYKTGKSPEKRNPETDRQLTLYALAACDKSLYGANPSSVTVSLYFLENLTKTSAKKTGEQLSQMRELIKSGAENIGKTDYAPTPGKQCDFCEFRLICEAWK